LTVGFDGDTLIIHPPGKPGNMLARKEHNSKYGQGLNWAVVAESRDLQSRRASLLS
jgi:hypothetical protein